MTFTVEKALEFPAHGKFHISFSCSCCIWTKSQKNNILADEKMKMSFINIQIVHFDKLYQSKAFGYSTDFIFLHSTISKYII